MREPFFFFSFVFRGRSPFVALDTLFKGSTPSSRKIKYNQSQFVERGPIMVFYCLLVRRYASVQVKKTNPLATIHMSEILSTSAPNKCILARHL